MSVSISKGRQLRYPGGRMIFWGFELDEQPCSLRATSGFITGFVKSEASKKTSRFLHALRFFFTQCWPCPLLHAWKSMSLLFFVFGVERLCILF